MMKKRILTGFIAAAIVLCGAVAPTDAKELTLLSVNAEAAVTNGIGVSATTLGQNDEFTVTINVPATSGTADSAELWVDFDPTAFEVVTWAPSAQMTNFDNTQGFFALASAYTSINLSSGLTYSAVMKVKSTAPAGSYNFTIRKGSLSYISGADGKTTTTLWTPSVKTATVSVKTNSVSGKISVKGTSGTATVALKDTSGKLISNLSVRLSLNSSSKAYEGSYSFSDAPAGSTIEISLPKCPVYKITVGSNSVENAVLRMYGDIDGNGVIEAIDATQILRYKVGMTSWIKGSDGVTDEYIKSAACIQGGSEPSERDATAILRYVTGYTSGLTGI